MNPTSNLNRELKLVPVLSYILIKYPQSIKSIVSSFSGQHAFLVNVQCML